MWIFQLIFSKIFDLIFLAFRGLNPWLGMTIISFLTGLLMLCIFRFTSNQEGIKKVKNRVKAHLLEVRLFKDSLQTTFQAQGHLFLCTFKYMSYSLRPMLVMIVPLMLILIQLNFWFGYQSLRLGEAALLKVKLQEEIDLLNLDIKIEPSSGVIIDSPPLRIEEEREIDWRLKPVKKGLHDIVVHIQDRDIIKKVAVEERSLSKISPVKVQHHFLDELLYPGERPISRDIPVERIEIAYPIQYMNFLGWNIHWLIAYFALSILFGFLLKGFFNVEL